MYIYICMYIYIYIYICELEDSRSVLIRSGLNLAPLVNLRA